LVFENERGGRTYWSMYITYLAALASCNVESPTVRADASENFMVKMNN
jgi:hypothetical protein